MSIKGRLIAWLDAAIDRGDVAAAVSAAAEMKHATRTVSLDYALAVLVLTSKGDAGVFDRTARWWAQRWLEERVNPARAMRPSDGAGSSCWTDCLVLSPSRRWRTCASSCAWSVPTSRSSTCIQC